MNFDSLSIAVPTVKGWLDNRHGYYNTTKKALNGMHLQTSVAITTIILYRLMISVMFIRLSDRSYWWIKRRTRFWYAE